MGVSTKGDLYTYIQIPIEEKDCYPVDGLVPGSIDAISVHDHGLVQGGGLEVNWG